MGSCCAIARKLGTLTVLLLSPSAYSAQLDYEVGLGIEHNDNVNLSENDPVSADILEPRLGFNLQQEGSTLQANAAGLLEYHDYLGGEFSDDFRGQVAAFLNWTVTPERLNLTVQDTLGVQPINSLEPNTPNNQQQTNVFAIGPTLNFLLGSAMHGQAELHYISSYADKTEEFNTNRLEGAVRAIRDLDAVSAISANIDDEYVDFTDSAGGPNYSRFSTYARYTRKWARLDLVADAGYSWLNYSSSGVDDRDNPLLRAKANWSATDRSKFTLGMAYQFSDAASDMIDDANIGTSIPTSITTGEVSITSQPYVERELSVGYAYTGDRMTFGITPYYRGIEYINTATIETAGTDQKARGAAATFSWMLRPLLSAGFGVTGENLRYTGLDREDNTWTATAALTQQWTRNWSGRVAYLRYSRSSNAVGQSSDQNIVYFAVIFTR